MKKSAFVKLSGILNKDQKEFNKHMAEEKKKKEKARSIRVRY